MNRESSLKKLFVLTLLACAIYPAVAADNSSPKLVVPANSGLTVIPDASPSLTDPPADATVTAFSGKISVSGEFIAQWPADLKHLNPQDQLEVSIKLDKKELSRLPYYDWPEWKKSYIPDSVDIINSDEAVKLVLPKQLSAKLLNKEIQFATVHANFLLTGYRIGIECDWPWAHATLLSAKVTETAQTDKSPNLDGC